MRGGCSGFDAADVRFSILHCHDYGVGTAGTEYRGCCERTPGELWLKAEKTA
jgi:hypothetical protein